MYMNVTINAMTMKHTKPKNDGMQLLLVKILVGNCQNIADTFIMKYRCMPESLGSNKKHNKIFKNTVDSESIHLYATN